MSREYLIQPHNIGLAYLFLLHEFRIGTIIHDITAKDRCRERRIYFFSTDISNFAIENEIVTLGT